MHKHTLKFLAIPDLKSVSISLPWLTEGILPTRTITAVKNTAITTYGQCSLTLNLGLRCSLPWIFVIADIQKPILGADFLRLHYGLMADTNLLTHTHSCRYRVSSPKNSLLVHPSVLQAPPIPTRNSCLTSHSLKSLSPILPQSVETA